MREPGSSSAFDTITRREALQRAAAVLGVVLSPSLFNRLLAAEPAPAGARSLSATQLATATALADRILPRTDTPGALDVGVPEFLDLMHGAYLAPDEKSALDAALAHFERAAQTQHESSFAALPPGRQDALLTAVAESENVREHFLRVRELVVVGYFTSEEVGKNVLRWDPVPGVFLPCIPLSEVGNASWTWSR